MSKWEYVQSIDKLSTISQIYKAYEGEFGPSSCFRNQNIKSLLDIA